MTKKGLCHKGDLLQAVVCTPALITYQKEVK